MEASVDDWGGNAEVVEHVTPVEVEVEIEISNGSDRKLRLRYRDFKLEAGNGEVDHALPLYKIGGTVTEPVIISDRDYTPAEAPGYYARWARGLASSAGSSSSGCPSARSSSRST